MKLKYKVYKDNQLAITRGKKLLKPYGKFIIDNNRLIYEVKESDSWLREYNLPKRITLEGKWILDKNHNLGFSVRKTKTQAGRERLILKSEIVAVKKNSLVFSLGTKGKEGTYKAYSLNLRGRWQADKYNRLQFLIKRSRTESDVLTLKGIWEVHNNTILYTHKKTVLKTKRKKTHVLRFKGYWQINKRNHLIYILDLDSNSYFEFKAYLQTPNIIGKKGVIKYRVGIGIRGSRIFRDRVISLYGIWKFSRKTGLSLVLDYVSGKISAISFGIFLRMSTKSKITLGLVNRRGEDLGISVTFTQKFLKNNANWFLRLIKEEKYPRFEWGVKLPF